MSINTGSKRIAQQFNWALFQLRGAQGQIARLTVKDHWTTEAVFSEEDVKPFFAEMDRLKRLVESKRDYLLTVEKAKAVEIPFKQLLDKKLS
jgi:hypothetical protein